MILRVEGAVGVEVTGRWTFTAGGQEQLVLAGDDDLVTLADSAENLDPTSIRTPEVGIDSYRLVGIGWVSSEDHRHPSVSDDRAFWDRQFESSALQDHFDQPQRSQQWAEEAEALVRTEFTVDAMVDALETLYAKLLA